MLRWEKKWRRISDRWCDFINCEQYPRLLLVIVGNRQQWSISEARSRHTIARSRPNPFRVLGVTFSPDLSLDDHVARVSATCFYWLRQFRRVRRSLDDDAMKTLVQRSSRRIAEVHNWHSTTCAKCSSSSSHKHWQNTTVACQVTRYRLLAERPQANRVYINSLSLSAGVWRTKLRHTWCVLMAQRLGHRTFDQAVACSILGRGVISSPRSTQPSIPHG